MAKSILIRSTTPADTAKTKQGWTPQYQKILEFRAKLSELLSQDRYLARSDYRALIDEYKEAYTFFDSLKVSEMLFAYCEKNSLKLYDATSFITEYEDLKDLKTGAKLISEHNNRFINRHLWSDGDYLKNILKSVDPEISLDYEQRKVVLSDEDYTLVVAGAGAGKTTTVAAKVRYLVEKQGVRPEQILVISFTNKAVGELRDKINRSLKIDCPVTTFHKTGFAILRKQDWDKKKVVDSAFLYDAVNNYLKNEVLHEPRMVDNLIQFFGSYFEAPYEGEDLNEFFNYVSKSDFTSLRSNVNDYVDTIINVRTGKSITINYEALRSAEEVRIANFLYLNKIDYDYEKRYPYTFRGSHRAYTPDFTITQNGQTIYLEHFGITEAGTHSRYNSEQLEKYKKEVNDKIRLHREHGTTLIYTYSQYNDGRSTLEHLKEELLKNGILLEPRPAEEVYKKLVSTEENKYILKLVRLICTFISNFKTNGYSVDKFREMEQKTDNVRTRLFLDFCHQCYLEYEKKLKIDGAVDFEDMINGSARILQEQESKKAELDFKYIIIDEYQDISRQRFNLAQALSKVCDAKIIAVGDDWQSIYAYAGADITLFTKFVDIMGYGEELKITKTYRNSQEVIDIAGNFIQKNSAQIQKTLVSPKHIEHPVVVEPYSEYADTVNKGGKFFLLGQAVERVIGQIFDANKREGKSLKSSILLIGRYGFDAFNLSRSDLFEYDVKKGTVLSKKYPEANISFLTAHRSKGLGYDNVVIINAMNSVYGFPAKICDDPIMKLVVKSDNSIEYAEERRLFYVAMTRTKNRVYIVVPEQRPSRFVVELVKDYPQNIQVNGKLDINIKDSPDIAMIKRCPACGYPLQYRHRKSFGLKLWICTNEPEICDFMTNDLRGGDLPILKCPKCEDGYLIVKPGKKEPFLGCTNYKADKTGCDGFMTREYYQKERLRSQSYDDFSELYDD